MSIPTQLGVADKKMAVSIQETTGSLEKVINASSTTNFVVALFLGSSMASLWSMIRAMQMIVLYSLLAIKFPVHAELFFKAAIAFAAMDMF